MSMAKFRVLGRSKKINPHYKKVVYDDQSGMNPSKVLGGGDHDWQVEAYNDLIDSPFNLITAPCGSGKSTVQAALAIGDIVESNYERKQLFLVPQTHIADGFFKPNGEFLQIEILGNTFYAQVHSQHNFCQDSSDKKANLRKWLTRPSKTLAKFCDGNRLGGLLAMASYQAFARVWREMDEDEKLQASVNIHVHPDESHHIAMGSETGDRQNYAGAALRFIYEKGTNSRITKSTATGFRCDGRVNIPESILDNFKSYKLDFIRHFNTLGIREFLVEITEAAKNPIKQVVREVAREKREHHYIVVPPSNAGWRSFFRDESGGIDELVKEIKKQWPGVRILNFVPQQEGRKSKKTSLLDEPKVLGELRDDGSVKEPQYDIVITCMLGREGTDWCPASRLHVTYVEGSIVLAVQTLGRLLRKFKGKTKIVARYYYPQFPEPIEGMTQTDLLLDNRKNVLLLMTQIDELFFPIVFDPLPSERKGKKKGNRVTLEDAMGSDAYQQMKEEFLSKAIWSGIVDGTEESLEAVIESVIDAFDIEPDLHDRARATLKTIYLRRADARFKGITADFIREKGFPRLYNKLTRLGKTLAFDHGADRMRLLQRIMNATFTEKIEELKFEMKRLKITGPEGVKRLPTHLRVWFNLQKRRSLLGTT